MRSQRDAVWTQSIAHGVDHRVADGGVTHHGVAPFGQRVSLSRVQAEGAQQRLHVLIGDVLACARTIDRLPRSGADQAVYRTGIAAHLVQALLQPLDLAAVESEVVDTLAGYFTGGDLSRTCRVLRYAHGRACH